MKGSNGRRANGESSIYQDDEGGWHAWVTIGKKPNGDPDRRHRRGKTRADVLTKVRDLERARAAGAVAQAGVRWTVASWVEHYIENIRGDALAPRTVLSYRGHLEEWIRPHLGRIGLAALQTEDIEKLFTVMRSFGLTAATCERVKATLRAALTVAVRRNLIVRNVAGLAQVGFRDTQADHASPLTAVEAQRLMSQLDGHPDAARWALALMGMRPAEVLGLDWADVDLEGGWVKVRQQLVRVYPYRHGCQQSDDSCRALRPAQCHARIGGRMLTGLKSKDSRRRLSLPPEVVGMLRARRAIWLEVKLRSTSWQRQWGDLVFCQLDGVPVDSAADRDSWLSALKGAGISARRMYDARHTAGTLLLEEGGDIHQVKDQLGHSQISVTSRYYLHATDRLATDSAGRLGDALFGSKSERRPGGRRAN